MWLLKLLKQDHYGGTGLQLQMVKYGLYLRDNIILLILVVEAVWFTY